MNIDTPVNLSSLRGGDPGSSSSWGSSIKHHAPRTIGFLARGLVTTLSAAAIAAGYQVISEEMRGYVNGAASRREVRSRRNEILMLRLIKRQATPALLSAVRGRRDHCQAAFDLLTNPGKKITTPDRQLLLEVMDEMIQPTTT